MAERPLVATYSIAACDLQAGQWGVAVQSKFLAVGSVVPWAEPHVGAVATQAWANPRYGPTVWRCCALASRLRRWCTPLRLPTRAESTARSGSLTRRGEPRRSPARSATS